MREAVILSDSSELTDLSDKNSSEYNSLKQSDDGESDPTNYSMSGDESEDNATMFQLSRELVATYHDTTLVDEISTCDEDEELNADADADEEDESDEEPISDYPQILQQRQSSFDNQVFFFKSAHHFSLTSNGIHLLNSTEEGRVALRDHQIEGEKMLGRSREVPQRYKSPDLTQLLINCPEASLYPVIAKDDEILLKFDMTIMFPNRKDHRKPSAVEIHRSGLNTAIHGFFNENREGLGIRQIIVLPPDFDDDYFTVLLSLEPGHQFSSRSTKPPLAILKSIVIKLRSTNKGHRNIQRHILKRRRKATCRAILARKLPLQLLTTLERCLNRFTQMDLVQKYGALFNSVYSSRASEVECHVLRIAKSMAEMYLRHEKLQMAIEEADKKGNVENKELANHSGLYKFVLFSSDKDVDKVKARTEMIQTELIDLDRREIPKKEFKPLLFLSSCAEKKKKCGISSTIVQRSPSNQPSPSWTIKSLQLIRPSQSFQSSQSSQSSSLSAYSPSNRRRSKRLSLQAFLKEEPLVRSSKRIKDQDAQVALPKTYAEFDTDSEDDIAATFTLGEKETASLMAVISDDKVIANASIRETEATTLLEKETEDSLHLLSKHLGSATDEKSQLACLELAELSLSVYEKNQKDSKGDIEDSKKGFWEKLKDILHNWGEENSDKDECFLFMKYLVEKGIDKEVNVEAMEYACDIETQSGELPMKVDEQVTVEEEEGEPEAKFSWPRIILNLRTRSRLSSHSSASTIEEEGNADDEEEQGRVRKRIRVDEVSQGDEKLTSRSAREEEIVQVNGGCVDGEEVFKRRVIADDDENRLELLGLNTKAFSLAVKQPEVHSMASLPVVEQPSSQVSGDQIDGVSVDNAESTQRRTSLPGQRDKNETHYTVVDDHLKFTEKSQITGHRPKFERHQSVEEDFSITRVNWKHDNLPYSQDALLSSLFRPASTTRTSHLPSMPFRKENSDDEDEEKLSPQYPHLNRRFPGVGHSFKPNRRRDSPPTRAKPFKHHLRKQPTSEFRHKTGCSKEEAICFSD